MSRVLSFSFELLVNLVQILRISTVKDWTNIFNEGMNCSMEMEVESIIGKRTVENGNVEYRVKWRGYSEAESTWELQSNLESYSGMIEAFEEAFNATENESNSNEENSTEINNCCSRQEEHQANLTEQLIHMSLLKSENFSAVNTKECNQPRQVQRILDKRLALDGQLEYRVVWKDANIFGGTWERAENLENAEELIKQFEIESDRARIVHRQADVVPRRRGRPSKPSTNSSGTIAGDMIARPKPFSPDIDHKFTIQVRTPSKRGRKPKNRLLHLDDDDDDFDEEIEEKPKRGRRRGRR
ncbi:Chromo domain protein LHP1 [Trichinella spiralis]|uniref:Chromo domain protein LHP1 n=1 Tax=Trichinella spiralis TaxID=6334 RepID=A0A0V1BXR6_TRISP|nr:Chromo domain protein LHP1 [Trichinella spiralis]